MSRFLKGSITNHWGGHTVATLPAIATDTSLEDGDIAFASDGLKGAETTGNGTGVLVYYATLPAPAWYSVQTGIAVGT